MDLIKARELLELNENFTDEELKSNHKKLVKKYHPDNITTGNEKRFLEIEEAYNYLNNKEYLKGNNNSSFESDSGNVCPVCGGRGWKRKSVKTPNGLFAQKVKCSYCKGKGVK